MVPLYKLMTKVGIVRVNSRFVKKKTMENLQQLEEGKIANALGAVSIGAAMVFGGHHLMNNQQHTPMENSTRIHPIKQSYDDEVHDLASKITSKYKHVDYKTATKYAQLAKKHEKEEFPKAKDILAVAGIESSFNPNAKSGLKVDKARGLLQVRPKVWGLDAKKDLATPDQQIKHGADILHSYHQKLGDVDASLHSYNIGLTNFKRGTNLNPKYVEKFKKERELYN